MRTRRSYADSPLDWDSFFDGGPPPPRARAAQRNPMARTSRRPWNVASEIESFATGAAVTVSSLQLRSTLATVTESQLERWRAGTTVLIEGDQWARRILRNDYWAGVGIPDPGTHFGQAQWWSAVAWSAVFIMACARKTQAALRLPNPILGHSTLTENHRHAAYCWQAFRDRTAGTSGRYWAYRPADALVEVGDIVAKTREAVTVAQAWAATSAPAFNSFTSHADIVVRIEDNNARVIGGNLGTDPNDSVRRTSYALTASGRINTTGAANDANRVFAVLKPIGGPFSGRLLGMIA